MAKRHKKTSRADNQAGGASYRYIAWALLAGAWLLLVAALMSFDSADPPSHTVGVPNVAIHNWVGIVGATLAYKTYFMFGAGIWIALAGLSAYLMATALGKKVDQLILRGIGLLLMTMATSTILAICLPRGVVGFVDRPEGAGGLIAVFVGDQLLPRFATPGSLLMLAVMFWIGAILAVDRLVLMIPRLIGEAAMRIGDLRWSQNLRLPRVELSAVMSSLSLWRNHAEATLEPKRTSTKTRPHEAEVIDELAGGIGATQSFDPDDYAVENDEEDEQEEDEPQEKAKRFDPEELRAKIKQLPINFAPESKNKVAPPRETDLSGYEFPSLQHLDDPQTNFTEEMEQLVREQALELESAMRQYRIEGEVVGIDSGPVITLFEVRLAPGTKVARLNAVSSDLARALRAHNIRIVPNMAGKNTVGIEVPNQKKERVAIKELMTTERAEVSKMKLPMFLGKDASGNPLIQDLAAMPHMLIAGTTGSGKSVCMNSIIMSFLYTKRPDELKLVLVDPKMVEMSMFKDIPHLMCPVVTEMAKAAAILEWAVTKMDERYELLAEASVRDLASYNNLGEEELRERMEPATEEDWARIPKKMPYMVFVIDELADLIITNKEVEASIVRIAQKARAVGIHLILATQRPQANVVTGLIKSNMPCRIAFKVASGMDSRIVLDQKGGELLLGHGDMLFLSPQSSKLVRAQGTFVDDMEVRKTVKFLKNIAMQNFEPSLVQIKSISADGEFEGERDPMFNDAVEMVLDKQKGSVSYLQRALRIGYSRSSRLFEQMEAYGIVGPQNRKGQERDVLIGIDEWQAMKAQVEADAAVTPPGSIVEEKVEEQTDEAVEEIEKIDEEIEEGEDEQEDEEETEEYEYEEVDEDGEYEEYEEEDEEDDEKDDKK